MKSWRKIAAFVTILSTGLFLLGISPAFASTFGYSVVGGNQLSRSANEMWCSEASPGGNGTATGISANLANGGTNFSMQGALYDQSGNLLSPQTSVVTVNSASKTTYTMNFTGGPSLTNQTYSICIFTNNTTANNFRLSYDTSPIGADWFDTNTYNSWPVTETPSPSTLSLSIWATFIPAASSATHTRYIQTRGAAIQMKGAFIMK